MPGSLKSDFALALHWISQIPREDAQELIRENIRQIEQHIRDWEVGLEIKGKT